VTIGVLSGTRRATPHAAVCGRSGIACKTGTFSCPLTFHYMESPFHLEDWD